MIYTFISIIRIYKEGPNKDGIITDFRKNVYA